MNSPTIICLDGPAGSGKSTVSRLLAERLGFLHLDTGAMYRTVAFLAGEHGIDWADETRLAELAHSLAFEFLPTSNGPQILVNGRDVSGAIRRPEISRGASIVSQHPKLRAELVAQQRRIGQRQSLVAEGRDMGTVVFPAATLKVYLDASIHERAKRRLLELREKNPQLGLEEVELEVAERDRRDTERAAAPLKAAADAVVLDTTALTLDDVLAELSRLVEERRHAT